MKAHEVSQAVFNVVGEKNMFFRSVFAALILSLLIAGALTFILGFSVDNGRMNFSIKNEFVIPIFTVFIACLSVFSTSMVLTNRREADDVFTPYRKQLEGTYTVKITIQEFNEKEGKFITKERSQTCTMWIDAKKKLAIKHTVVASDILADDEYTISHTSFAIGSKIQLFYFSKRDAKFNERASQTLGSQSVLLQECALLEFEETQGAIQKLSGMWYDVDGELGAALRKHALAINSNTQVPELHNGSVEFKRINK